MIGTAVTLAAAFTGGVVSFASPCVLPIMPAYLAVVTGVSGSVILGGGRSHLRRVLVTALGFIAGFTLVFVLLGLSITAVGQALAVNRVLLGRISGLVVLAMALFLLASLVLRAPWLYQEARWRPTLGRYGPYAAPIAGVAFGFGWTPCIGSVLTSVLALAATTGQGGRGALTLLAYSAGLGLPFLASALVMDRLTGVFGFARRHFLAMTITSATTMAIFGTLLALNRMSLVTTTAQHVLSTVGLSGLLRLG